MKIRWEELGNDLFAEVECTCPHKDPDLAKYGAKHRFNLSGYGDRYFFKTVNKEPRHGTCPRCGRGYTEQWSNRGYVEVKWDDDRNE